MSLMSRGLRAALVLAVGVWAAPALAQPAYEPPRTSE
jgi:hypothetical protein